MLDKFNREIDYLRISITDKCNCFCVYCGNDNCNNTKLLSYQQINQIVDKAVKCGIKKFKVTGGEPFYRKGAVDFICQLKNRTGVDKVTITTNGTLLSFDDIDKLSNVDGINFSLDSLENESYYQITKNKNLQKVLDNINYAKAKGINVKLNVVLSEYTTKEDINQMKQFIAKGITVRFIELMKTDNNPIKPGLNSKEVLEIFGNCKEVAVNLGNGPATYYQVEGYSGYIGFIEPVCNKFCHQCNRIRLTCDGYLKPCLFHNENYKINFEADLKTQIETAIINKPIGHNLESDSLKIPMVKVGG